jgi:hypothetical protein
VLERAPASGQTLLDLAPVGPNRLDGLGRRLVDDDLDASQRHVEVT